MKRSRLLKLAMLVLAVLMVASLASACNKTDPAPRLPTSFSYNPGANFQTNINDEDPRRVVRCSVVFSVVDEEAITELAEYNYVIRNAVLIVLGELTLVELKEHRDLADIAQRMVDKVNEAINGNLDLVTGAYFTEFVYS